MKSKMFKKVLAAAMTAAMVLSLAACGSDSSSEDSSSSGEASSEESSEDTTAHTDIYDSASELYEEGGGNKVGITVIDNVIPHCQAFIEGAKSVIEENGDEAVVLDPGFDAVVQAENIDDFVAQGCVGVVCETIDGNALITSVQAAVDAGVMVSSADFPFAEGYEDLVCSQVMTPNQESAAALAEYAYKEIGDGANIVILCRPDAGSQARADGYREVAKKYGWNIVFDGDGGGEVEKSNEVMIDLLQANDKIDGVFCSNDEQAIGAYTAAESAGRADEVHCYGFDAAPEACEYIDAGQESASLGQQPYEMGRQSALDLYKAFKGEDVGNYQKDLGYTIITKENTNTRTEEYYTGIPDYEYE